MFAFLSAPRVRPASAAIMCVLAWLGPGGLGLAGLKADDAVSAIRIGQFYYGGAARAIGQRGMRAVGFSKNGDLLVCWGYLPHGDGGTRIPGGEYFYLWKINTGVDVHSDVSEFSQFTTTPFARAYHWTDSAIELQDDLTDSTNIRTIRLKQMDLTPESRGMGRAFFSADDRRIAGVHARDSKSLSIWDSRSGDLVAKLALSDKGAGGNVLDVAFDADDRYVAAEFSPHGGHSRVLVWDLSSGQQVLRQEQSFLVRQVAFCPNGDLVCAGDKPTMKHYETYAETSENGTDGVIVVMRRGKPGAEEKPGTTVGQTETFHTVQTMLPEGGVFSIALADAGLVAGCDHGRVSLWDLAAGKQLAVLRDGSQDAYHQCRVGVRGNTTLIACAGQSFIPRVDGTLIACTSRYSVDLFLINSDAAKK